MLQSTLVLTALKMHPEMRSTMMSMCSFNVFLGGATGTAINAQLIKTHGTVAAFHYSPYTFLVAGVFAAVLIAYHERKDTEHQSA